MMASVCSWEGRRSCDSGAEIEEVIAGDSGRPHVNQAPRANICSRIERGYRPAFCARAHVVVPKRRESCCRAETAAGQRLLPLQICNAGESTCVCLDTDQPRSKDRSSFAAGSAGRGPSCDGWTCWSEEAFRRWCWGADQDGRWYTRRALVTGSS